MSIKVKVGGAELTFRAPTLEEIAAYRRDEGMRSVRVARKLVEACGDAADLLSKQPAAAIKLSLAILKGCGMLAEVIELEESDLDEEMAKAYVAAQDKGFAGLHCYSYEEHGHRHRLICREPRERELDDYMRDELAPKAAQALVVASCVWCDKDGASRPNVLAIEHTAPGLYVPIAMLLCRAAGMTADIELGE